MAQRLREMVIDRDRRPQGEDRPKAARPERTNAEYAQAAKALGETLLNPVADLLNRKRLVIVADGALQAVPFATLPMPNREMAATTPAALVQDHEILGLPSISVLAIQRREIEKNRKPAPYAVAVLANPVFDQNDARVKRGQAEDRTRPVAVTQSPPPTDVNANSNVTRVLRDVGLGTIPPPLFHSREEADSIRKLVPKGKVKLALDFEASRAVALSPELSQYRIIHFATHSILDLEHPELSGIILSMVDEKGKPQDGYLRLHDIYQLNLPADLVVLSACETGVGKQVKGEGVIALTRGFMYAGAARVIASLWKVDDAATAELMARFYREMFVNRLAPAAALREAQNQLRQIRRWQAPYYWAGFVIQGDWK
jgi:CHAT domain-containing protein